MNFFDCAWLWVYAGAALILFELVTPGFVMCFFGLAAITVGALRGLLGAGFSPAWQAAAFSAVSVLYICLLRKWFKRALTGGKVDNGDLPSEFVGRTGKVVTAIVPPHPGRIVLGDAEWSAVADVPIAVDADVKVISQNNLTMKVEVL